MERTMTATKSRFPKLLIKVDKEFEKHKVGAFFIEKAFKTNSFLHFDKFIKEYPELSNIKEMKIEDAKEFFNKKIDEYYIKEEAKLLEDKKEVRKKWNKTKDEFYVEAEKIFDNHKWPSGKYIAVVSLFGMFRFVPGTKSFSVPRNDFGGNPVPGPGQINACIAHEMMHVMFEDFYEKHFNKEELPLQKYYDLLEITNYIVLNLPQMNKLTGWVFYPYSNHKERAEHLKRVYSGCKNMKEFIGKAIEYLKENQ